MWLNLLFPLFGALAGILLGWVLALRNYKFLKILLTFSGAFLLGIAITHLLPAAYAENPESTAYWVLGGLVLQLVLESWTKGAEHGHRHHEMNSFPVLLWLGLCLHALLEGLPLHFYPELKWGMLIHKIPVSLVLYLLLFQEGSSRTAHVLLLGIFALMTPIGGLLPTLLTPLQVYAPEMTALVTGVLLHISTTIIFESNSNHKLQFQKLLGLLLGFLIALII
ncbi:MAG: ZIP family metal transporter [Flavobacteriaceae bacterium]